MFSSQNSQVSSDANYIEDVFSTYLYNGTGSAQTITNGIDLSTKGGLVWIKSRETYSHRIFDTARGVGKTISSNSTGAQFTDTTMLSAFNTTGFSLGSDSSGGVNDSGYTFASWTFRKQPKFFDVVTYTGDGTAGRQIAHSLNSSIGAIIVKNTNVARDWAVWHRSLADGTYLKLNTTDAAITNTSFQVFGDASGQTSTYFTVGKTGSGVNGLTNANASGETYVAYLFAHNAGGFGLTGTDNVISCGSYTGTSDYEGPVVNLGFEPQWLLIKSAGSVKNWVVLDNMRGLTAGGDNEGYLVPNTSDQEYSGTLVKVNATGFQANGSSMTGSNGVPYIYIAIRRGPMKVPTSGTSVFQPIIDTGDTIETSTATFPLDMQFNTLYNVSNATYNNQINDRLRGIGFAPSFTTTPHLTTASTAAETTSSSYLAFKGNGMDVTKDTGWGATSAVFYNFRRAPSFFDEVCYTGTGSATTQTHNLGVAPEMMITKVRTGSSTSNWAVYHKALGATDAVYLDLTDATTSWIAFWNNTAPTASVFSLGGSSYTNNNGGTLVAYLFATCAGVSKVGSYTGTGTTQQINCGFTGGARFVMIKRTDSTGGWYVWDSARGIVAGNDPYLLLNSTAAEVTNTDYVDPYSAGFEISSTAPAAINASGGTFIFLAIA